MTQPIQEPGQTTRTDAKLTWGSNQLFRRPAPAPGDFAGLPYAYFYEDSDETVETGGGGADTMPGPNWTDPDMGVSTFASGTIMTDFWMISDLTLFELSGGFLVYRPGIYLIQGAGRWTVDVGAGNSSLYIGTNNTLSPHDSFPWQYGDVGSLDLYQQSIRTFVQIQGDFDQVYFQYTQNSGSTKTLEWNWGLIVQLSPTYIEIAT